MSDVRLLVEVPGYPPQQIAALPFGRYEMRRLEGLTVGFVMERTGHAEARPSPAGSSQPNPAPKGT